MSSTRTPTFTEAQLAVMPASLRSEVETWMRYQEIADDILDEFKLWIDNNMEMVNDIIPFFCRCNLFLHHSHEGLRDTAKLVVDTINNHARTLSQFDRSLTDILDSDINYYTLPAYEHPPAYENPPDYV